MKSVILRSALVLGLGVVPGIGLAQTEIIKKKPGQQTQEQAPSEQPAQEQDSTTGQSTEGKTGTEAEGGTGAAIQQQTEGGADAPKQPDAQGEAGATPQGQTEGEAAGSAQPKTDDESGGAAQTQQPAPTESTTETQDQPSTETTGSVDVTAEQQTQIKQVITETKVEPVRDIDVSIDVGVTVPNTVELHPLPQRIVEVVPRYQGYLYFVLEDGRVVIVEPDTLEVVLIVA